MLDGGLIRGGFPANYEARIVPRQGGPLVQAIAAVTGTDRLPRIDVEVQTGTGKPWLCSFEGNDARSSLFTTPDPIKAGVATDRLFSIFLIDTSQHRIDEVWMSTPVECAASDTAGGRLFLATGIDVVAVGKAGVLWRSKRVSLDGITMLSYSAGCVRGIRTPNEKIFSIDAATGQAEGGFDLGRPVSGS